MGFNSGFKGLTLSRVYFPKSPRVPGTENDQPRCHIVLT